MHNANFAIAGARRQQPCTVAVEAFEDRTLLNGAAWFSANLLNTSSRDHEPDAKAELAPGLFRHADSGADSRGQVRGKSDDDRAPDRVRGPLPAEANDANERTGRNHTSKGSNVVDEIVRGVTAAVTSHNRGGDDDTSDRRRNDSGRDSHDKSPRNSDTTRKSDRSRETRDATLELKDVWKGDDLRNVRGLFSELFGAWKDQNLRAVRDTLGDLIDVWKGNREPSSMDDNSDRAKARSNEAVTSGVTNASFPSRAAVPKQVFEEIVIEEIVDQVSVPREAQADSGGKASSNKKVTTDSGRNWSSNSDDGDDSRTSKNSNSDRSADSRDDDSASAARSSSSRGSASSDSKDSPAAVSTSRSTARASSTPRVNVQSTKAPAAPVARASSGQGDAVQPAFFVTAGEAADAAVTANANLADNKALHNSPIVQTSDDNVQLGASRESWTPQGTWTADSTADARGEHPPGNTPGIGSMEMDMSLAQVRLEMPADFQAHGSDLLADLVPILDLPDGYALANALDQLVDWAGAESLRSWLFWACGLGLAGAAAEIVRRQVRCRRDEDEVPYPELQAALLPEVVA